MRLPPLSQTRTYGHTELPSASATELVVDALAAYRMTRLASIDTFPAAVAVRDRISRWARTSGHPAIDEFVHCPWCIGFWIAAAVVVTRTRSTRAWDPIARTLAISAVAGVIAHYLSDEVIQVKTTEPAAPSAVDARRAAR
jgi:hypothetical protein